MHLVVPQQYNIYKIMAVDPGLNRAGVAIFDINYSNRQILAIDAFTLRNERLKDDTGLDEELYSERIIKLYKLKNTFYRILDEVRPANVISESAFYNPGMPMAHASLTETIRTIHAAVMEFNVNIQFNRVEPLLVKKTIGANMFKGKSPMKDAVMDKPELISVLRQNIETLDEHAIDAIAIGYTFLMNFGV